MGPTAREEEDRDDGNAWDYDVVGSLNSHTGTETTQHPHRRHGATGIDEAEGRLQQPSRHTGANRDGNENGNDKRRHKPTFWDGRDGEKNDDVDKHRFSIPA